MSRPFVALSFAAAIAAGCSGSPPRSAEPTHRDVELDDEAAIQQWVGSLSDGWKAVLTAVQATAAAYESIADTPTKTLATPEGMKEARDRVDLARDLVQRLESFGVTPPTGVAIGYREYSATNGPFVSGRRYYTKLLSEADLSKSGFPVIVRFNESLTFSNQAASSDTAELYASRDGAMEFFSARRRLVARTRGHLGGRRSLLECIEFFAPFEKVALLQRNGSIEDLIREIKR